MRFLIRAALQDKLIGMQIFLLPDGVILAVEERKAAPEFFLKDK